MQKSLARQQNSANSITGQVYDSLPPEFTHATNNTTAFSSSLSPPSTSTAAAATVTLRQQYRIHPAIDHLLLLNEHDDNSNSNHSNSNNNNSMAQQQQQHQQQQSSHYILSPCDYNSPTYHKRIKQLSERIDREYETYGATKQFERDAYLWTKTLQNPEIRPLGKLLQRIFVVLRYGGLMYRSKDSSSSSSSSSHSSHVSHSSHSSSSSSSSASSSASSSPLLSPASLTYAHPLSSSSPSSSSSTITATTTTAAATAATTLSSASSSPIVTTSSIFHSLNFDENYMDRLVAGSENDNGESATTDQIQKNHDVVKTGGDHDKNDDNLSRHDDDDDAGFVLVEHDDAEVLDDDDGLTDWNFWSDNPHPIASALSHGSRVIIQLPKATSVKNSRLNKFVNKMHRNRSSGSSGSGHGGGGGGGGGGSDNDGEYDHSFWRWLITGDMDGDLSKFISTATNGRDAKIEGKILFRRLGATHALEYMSEEQLGMMDQKRFGSSRMVGSSSLNGGASANANANASSSSNNMSSSRYRSSMYDLEDGKYNLRLQNGRRKLLSETKTSGLTFRDTKLFRGTKHTLSHHRHWGCNIPLGGAGERSLTGKDIEANGEHGHIYLYYMAPKKDRFGGVMIGVEGSEYGKYDQAANFHGLSAKSGPLGPTFGYKWHNTKGHRDLSRVKGRPDKYNSLLVDFTGTGWTYLMEKYECEWQDAFVAQSSLPISSLFFADATSPLPPLMPPTTAASSTASATTTTATDPAIATTPTTTSTVTNLKQPTVSQSPSISSSLSTSPSPSPRQGTQKSNSLTLVHRTRSDCTVMVQRTVSDLTPSNKGVVVDDGVVVATTTQTQTQSEQETAEDDVDSSSTSSGYYDTDDELATPVDYIDL